MSIRHAFKGKHSVFKCPVVQFFYDKLKVNIVSKIVNYQYLKKSTCTKEQNQYIRD
jgi:hypothetical protein